MIVNVPPPRFGWLRQVACLFRGHTWRVYRDAVELRVPPLKMPPAAALEARASLFYDWASLLANPPTAIKTFMRCARCGRLPG